MQPQVKRRALQDPDSHMRVNTPFAPEFRLKLAESAADRAAAQRLRYDVFVAELGGGGAGVDHAERLEIDPYDDVCDHLLLFDDRAGALAGVYRLIRSDHARQIGGFYSESEFDLTRLKATDRPLLELGRSCLGTAYRGGAAMYHLWTGLADYVAAHGIELMFGAASFHGTDTEALAAPLSLLYHRHLAPEEIRPQALAPGALDMNRMTEREIDRPAAMRAVPALIKAYLRLGGTVGQGAFVDRAFNTVDVCLVLDTARMNPRQRQIYTGTP